jgi:hypothetical protein
MGHMLAMSSSVCYNLLGRVVVMVVIQQLLLLHNSCTLREPPILHQLLLLEQPMPGSAYLSVAIPFKHNLFFLQQMWLLLLHICHQVHTNNTGLFLFEEN